MRLLLTSFVPALGGLAALVLRRKRSWLDADRPTQHRTTRRMAAWAIPLALGLSLVSGAHAAQILVPAGLNPGDRYRIIFVTSTTRDATSSNIADYNSFVTSAVNSDPGLAGLGTTWTALASTSAVNALTNAGLDPSDSTIRFFTTAGELIATGVVGNAPEVLYSTLFLAMHTSEIRYSNGDPAPVMVWTGTGFNGTSNNVHALGSNTPSAGRGDSTSAGWTSFFHSRFDPNQQASLYGISGELTVSAAPTAPVPEPSSLAMMGGAILALGLTTRRKVRK